MSPRTGAPITEHLRAPMRDLFPEHHHLADRLDTAVARIARAHHRRRIFSFAGNMVFYGVVIFVLGWIVALATDSKLPVVSKVEIITPAIVPGGDLSMRVTPHRFRLCEGRVSFVLFDGQGRMETVELGWEQPKGPLGEDKPFVRDVTLPYDSTPGDGRLRIQRQFRCPYNPFQQRWPIVETTRDMPFKILPRPKGAP